MLCIQKKRRFLIPSGFVKRSFKRLFWFQVVLLVYVLILIVIIGMGEGQHIINNIINLILFSFIPIVSFTIIFIDIHSFFKAIIWVTFLQTLAIWLCMLNPSFSQLIDYLFPPSEFAVESDLREGYSGGIACIAAPGVFKYGLGILACLYFILVEERTRFYYILILFGFTSILVARTGLFIFLSSFLVIFFYKFNPKKLKLSKILLFLLGTILVILIGYYSFNTSFIRDRLWRMQVLFELGAQAVFFKPYLEGSTTIIPPLSTETLIGTGIIYGKSGNGIEVVVDGGYIKLYVAYGLVIAFFFYLFLYLQMYRISRNIKLKPLSYLFFILLIYIIIAEFKEFIIYDMYMICFFYVSAFLYSKSIKFKDKK